MRLAIVALLVAVLAVSTPLISGNPTSTNYDDLPYCYLGMDTSENQCVMENEANYVYCKVKETARCRCAEGLKCRRDTLVNDAVTEPTCVFNCVIDDPEAYGLKPAGDYNQNMERI